jgi:hypothetical protein
MMILRGYPITPEGVKAYRNRKRNYRVVSDVPEGGEE